MTIIPILICDLKECKIFEEHSSMTLLHSTGYYDKEGIYVYEDPNTYYSNYKCFHCGRKWSNVKNSKEDIWREEPKEQIVRMASLKGSV